MRVPGRVAAAGLDRRDGVHEPLRPGGSAAAAVGRGRRPRRRRTTRKGDDEDRAPAAGCGWQCSSFLPERRGERAERGLLRTGRETRSGAAWIAEDDGEEVAVRPGRPGLGSVRIKSRNVVARTTGEPTGYRRPVEPGCDLDEGRDPVQDVGHDGLQRVAEPRVGDELRVRHQARTAERSSSIFANGSDSPDRSRTGQRIDGQWAIRASVLRVPRADGAGS